jgi:hypothetical protein
MTPRLNALLAALILCAIVPAFASEKSKHFGAPFTDAKEVSLKDVLTDTNKFAGKTLKVKGQIADVCQAKGCWLVVTDGEREMRVKFKDYGFFVPKESSGSKVILEGVVEKTTITEDHAKHLAGESKGGKDPSTIKGPQEVIQMTATGVEILD